MEKQAGKGGGEHIIKEWSTHKKGGGAHLADHFADFFPLIPQDSGLACCYSVQVVRHGLVKLRGGVGEHII